MLVRYTADLLNGVPSIVIGIFAWTVVVVPMHHFSAWAGGFALSLMMIPIVCAPPNSFCEASPIRCAKVRWLWAPARSNDLPP